MTLFAPACRPVFDASIPAAISALLRHRAGPILHHAAFVESFAVSLAASFVFAAAIPAPIPALLRHRTGPILPLGASSVWTP